MSVSNESQVCCVIALSNNLFEIKVKFYRRVSSVMSEISSRGQSFLFILITGNNESFFDTEMPNLIIKLSVLPKCESNQFLIDLIYG